MNCEELREHYELYALGIAEEGEAAEILAHLNRKCAACSAGVKEARALTTLIAATAPDRAPRPELRDRILASAGASEAAPAAQSKLPWAWVWFAAACMAGIAAVFFGVRENQTSVQMSNLERDLNQRTAESRERGARLAQLSNALAIVNSTETVEVSFGPGEPKPANGKVFVSPKQGVLLVASRLPAAPKGKIYEMWIIPRGGMPAPAGLFQSGPDGNAIHLQAGPVDVAATGAVAVTLESEGGAPQPTSTPLIVAALMPPRGVAR